MEERVRPILMLAVAAVCACSARSAPPSADAPTQPFPDISGRIVMLLPVQARMPTIGLPESGDSLDAPVPLSPTERAALEAELVYWLAELAPRIRWIMPAAIDRAARRAPTLDIQPRELSVGDFMRAELTHIGDPLYGELRTLNALLDARVALVPIGGVRVSSQEGPDRVHLAAALIDTFGGAVLWYGVVAGDPGAADDGAALASAAQALARLITR